MSFSPTPNPNTTVNPATGLASGHQTYKAWTSDSFPRMIAISLEQQTPYFPDSYSVNFANNGPYGDAVVEEVIPFLEERFRIIRAPYARQLEGASTSGWQSLALQYFIATLFGHRPSRSSRARPVGRSPATRGSTGSTRFPGARSK